MNKKKRRVPEKHKGKVHAVGAFAGHLKKATRMWNRVSQEPIKQNQMESGMLYRMRNPEPMTPEEVATAKNAGLTVKGQFCLTKM